MVQAQTASSRDPQGVGFHRPHPGREAHIVHLTAEYWPYIRTGGLGEAVRGMATFQEKEGSQASVILPLYQPIREGDFGLLPVGDDFVVQIGSRSERGRLWEATKGSSGPRLFGSIGTLPKPRCGR